MRYIARAITVIGLASISAYLDVNVDGAAGAIWGLVAIALLFGDPYRAE